jgi:hypothetical protein
MGIAMEAECIGESGGGGGLGELPVVGFGLEGAEFVEAPVERPLGAAGVEGEAFHCRVGGAGGGESQLETVTGAEVPGGVEDLLEEDLLQGAGGGEFLLQVGCECGELRLLIGGDGGLRAGESVGAGVLGS